MRFTYPFSHAGQGFAGPPPAAGRFDCVETHGLRPCRRLRRRACGLPPAPTPPLCTIPGSRPFPSPPPPLPSPESQNLPPLHSSRPRPAHALPLRCPLPKAKPSPHRSQAVSTASKHTGFARVGGSAAGPAACPLHSSRPIQPISSHAIPANSPPFFPVSPPNRTQFHPVL